MKIIAEAAMNHFGSVPLLWTCADVALSSGADFVKFQLIRDEALYAPGEYEYGTYEIEEVRWLRHHSRIPHDQYREIAERAARQKGYRCVTATPFDLLSLEELLETDPPFIKIASGDNNYFDLLAEAGRSGYPVVISTGMSTVDQIDRAVNRLLQYTSDIVLMHCVAEYPHDLSNTMLATIPWLKNRYQVPIGYSDHSNGYAAAVLAAALGAEWIEKHFSLCSANGGLDVKHSLNGDELEIFCRMVKETPAALEGLRSTPTKAEIQTAKRARRGLYYKHTLPVGHVVTENDIAYLRPEKSFALEDQNKIVNRKLTTAVENGTSIRDEDFE